VTGSCRKYDEELHNLYSLPNIITVIKSRMMMMGGACSVYRRDEKYIHNLV
jgi:hypothetical protein